MNTATMSYGMRARERMPFAWDFVTLGLTAALLLVGIVMVTSASMSIAAKDYTDPFYFLERQFIFAVAGVVLAWGMTRFPTELWHNKQTSLSFCRSSRIMASLRTRTSRSQPVLLASPAS